MNNRPSMAERHAKIRFRCRMAILIDGLLLFTATGILCWMLLSM